MFQDAVGNGTQDSMLSHGAATTFYEHDGGYLKVQKGVAQRIIGEPQKLLEKYIHDTDPRLETMVNEFDVIRQLTDPQLPADTRNKLVVSQPKLHSEYTALIEAGLTDDEIRIYFQADLAQYGSGFFKEHFGKAWLDTHLTPEQQQKFDEVGRRIYAKNGLVLAKEEDKDDVQAMCDGSIYILTEEIRLALAKRGVVFDVSSGGDDDTYGKLLEGRKGMTKRVHEAQRIKAYDDLPKIKLRMHNYEVPKDVYNVVEAEGVIYGEAKIRTYKEAAEAVPDAPIAKKISSGWLGQLKFVEDKFDTNDFLKRAVEATRTSGDLHVVKKEIKRISEELSTTMAKEDFSFVDAARYQFEEAKMAMTKIRHLTERVKAHMEEELRKQILNKNLAGLKDLAPNVVMVTDMANQAVSDDGGHFCRGIEMDEYLKGYELTQRGFLNTGNWLPLEQGLPDQPTEEWVKRNTATEEQDLPNPTKWLLEHEIKNDLISKVRRFFSGK